MKTLTRIAVVLLLSLLPACAQRISALLRTNAVAGTNLIPVMITPNATNGTRAISVDELFNNRATKDIFDQYYLNFRGETYYTNAWTNATGGTITSPTLFAIRPPTNSAVLLKVRMVAASVSTLTFGGCEESAAAWRTNVANNFGDYAVLVGVTTNTQQRNFPTFGLIWSVDGEDVLVAAYGTNDLILKAVMQTITIP
jgi:hypothetical protein